MNGQISNTEATTTISPAKKNLSLKRVKDSYLSTPINSIVSIICITVLTYLFWILFKWGVLNAVWASPDSTSQVCQNAEGACWAVIHVRWRLILFGLFPFDEQWRSTIACISVVVVTVMSCIPYFWSPLRLSVIWIIGFVVFYTMMSGGVFGMTAIDPTQWGGLTLTVFMYVIGVLIGMPAAICLALMRRSKLPVIAKTSGLIIDTLRSLPLVSILFTCALIIPFILPEFLVGDKIWRVAVGFALYFAIYQAEVLRSGIQALPSGQEEAAKALGLNYWQRTARVILPQAFRNALPPTINQLVLTFKETALIIIIGFFDVLASGNAAFGTGEWSFAWIEVYCFVAMIYFVFVFSLSRYGNYLERRMRVGEI